MAVGPFPTGTVTTVGSGPGGPGIFMTWIAGPDLAADPGAVPLDAIGASDPRNGVELGPFSSLAPPGDEAPNVENSTRIVAATVKRATDRDPGNDMDAHTDSLPIHIPT
jgi:hypothetical protein